MNFSKECKESSVGFLNISGTISKASVILLFSLHQINAILMFSNPNELNNFLICNLVICGKYFSDGCPIVACFS